MAGTALVLDKDELLLSVRDYVGASADKTSWVQTCMRRLVRGPPSSQQVHPPGTAKQQPALPGATGIKDSPLDEIDWGLLCRAVIEKETSGLSSPSLKSLPNAVSIVAGVARACDALPSGRFDVPTAQFFASTRLADPIVESFQEVYSEYPASAQIVPIVRGLWAVLQSLEHQRKRIIVKNPAETLKNLQPFKVTITILLNSPPPTVSPDEADARVLKYQAFLRNFHDQMGGEKELMQVSWLAILRNIARVSNVDKERAYTLANFCGRCRTFRDSQTRPDDAPFADRWNRWATQYPLDSTQADPAILQEAIRSADDLIASLEENAEDRTDAFFDEVIVPSTQSLHDFAKYFLVELVEALRVEHTINMNEVPESGNKALFKESIALVEETRAQVHLCAKNILRLYQLNADHYAAKSVVIRNRAAAVAAQWSSFVNELHKSGVPPLQARIQTATKSEIRAKIDRIDREIQFARTEFHISVNEIFSEDKDIIRTLGNCIERLQFFGVCLHDVLQDRTKAAISQAEKLMETLADETCKIISYGAMVGTLMLSNAIMDWLAKKPSHAMATSSVHGSSRATPVVTDVTGSATTSKKKKKKKPKGVPANGVTGPEADGDEEDEGPDDSLPRILDLNENTHHDEKPETVLENGTSDEHPHDSVAQLTPAVAVPPETEQPKPPMSSQETIPDDTLIGRQKPANLTIIPPLAPVVNAPLSLPAYPRFAWPKEEATLLEIIQHLRSIAFQYHVERSILLNELRTLRRDNHELRRQGPPGSNSAQDELPDDLRQELLELRSKNAVLQLQNDQLMAMLEEDKKTIESVNKRMATLDQLLMFKFKPELMLDAASSVGITVTEKSTPYPPYPPLPTVSSVPIAMVTSAIQAALPTPLGAAAQVSTGPSSGTPSLHQLASSDAAHSRPSQT